MLELNDLYPVMPDFSFFQKPYVLPLSLQEYWDNFYSDDGDYFYDKTLLAKGEKVGSVTNWMDPINDHYKMWFDQKVMQLKEITVEFELPPNPFVRDAWTTKHLMLLSKTETSLDVGVIDDQKGFPYATSFDFYERWEIRTTDPRSKQVCVRHTY